ncbi:hypothetical protein K474DRAFT_1442406 [Panus rudis PR-1116 ss-1]|nr:hypothetical protein K474DRAFT_1442406 [Panus rudis PR-1116 ss-1]
MLTRLSAVRSFVTVCTEFTTSQATTIFASCRGLRPQRSTSKLLYLLWCPQDFFFNIRALLSLIRLITPSSGPFMSGERELSLFVGPAVHKQYGTKSSKVGKSWRYDMFPTTYRIRILSSEAL